MNIDIVLSVLLDIKGIGTKKILGVQKKELKELITDKDVFTFYKILSDKYKRIEQLDLSDIEMLIEQQKRLQEHDYINNIRRITFLDELYPKKLFNLKEPPVMLYAKGNTDALNLFGIAIIGTRNITEYGKKIGFRLGEFMAENNVSVISGLAKGCDMLGHLGCLSKNGITVAILGTPLLAISSNNKETVEDIIQKNGCIVSEYKTGTKTLPYHFVARNRIQAALSNGVIVTECGIKSGTMHTVNETLAEQKPVGCFSYSSKHYSMYEQSRGNEYLINRRSAYALYDKESILNFIDICKNKDSLF